MELTLVTLLTLTLTLAPLISAQRAAPSPTSSSPSSSSSGPLNITGILDKAGNYHRFIVLLTTTRVDEQLNSQINNSFNGLTIICPTDNAFQSLKPGLVNDLSQEKQVDLALYHVLPRYYSLLNFETASNPITTQTSETFNVSTSTNEVNITTGLVKVNLGTALYAKLPLAMYSVEKVLLPPDLFKAKTTKAAAPPVSAPAKDAPSQSANSEGPAGSGSVELNVGWRCLVMALGFVAMLMGFGGGNVL